MNLLSRFFTADGIFARAMRSSLWATFGYFASQFIRLASNLVLTRILFPEAFGLMALVSVFMVGLGMLSDVGVGPSIMRSKRGDEADFLDTAWTIQVMRGTCLWLATCLLAWPIARFYEQPMLFQLLPVAGLSLLIGGFNPTRIETANRHLRLGRVITLDLVSQVIGIAVMVFLAWWLQSVWGLALGGVVSALAKLGLTMRFLSGHGNRFHWNREDVSELVHFGKWIFLSSAFGFVMAQGDRAVFGKYLSIDMLGIYNIGSFLATFPPMLSAAVTNKILIPLYREIPTIKAEGKLHRIRNMRFALTGSILTLQFTIAFSGVLLIGLLYDPRYAAAGPITVMVSLVNIPVIIGSTYDQVALAAGDSRIYFFNIAIRAIALITFFVVGVEIAGLPGALIGQSLAALSLHGMTIWLARRYDVWDWKHDAFYGFVSAAICVLVVYFNRDSIYSMF